MRKFFTFILIFIAISLFAKPFHFVVMGDNRPSYKYQPYIYYKITKQIADLKPDFIVSTGDIIAGHDDNPAVIDSMYRDFLDASKSIEYIPLYIAPGNHEETDEKELKPIFLKYFKKTYQSFTYNNSYFIILNTNEPGFKYQIAGKQYRWLKKQLNKANKEEYKHIFVFIHHPLYPKIHHIGSSLDKFPEERDKLVKLFKDKNVETVFAGHVHIYNNSFINGIHQIITGGAGAPLYSKDYANGGFYHFLYITVDDNEVNYAIIPVENELRQTIKAYKKGNKDQARACLKEAIKFMPDHPEVLFTRYLLVKDKNIIKKDIFSKISKRLGSEYNAYIGLAHFFYNHGFEADAKLMYEAAIKISPENQEPYFRLARIYEKNNEKDTALQYYKLALKYTKKQRYLLYLMKKIKELQGGKL